MKIIEVIAYKPGYPLFVWAARDKVEALLMARVVQEEGGIPMLNEIEVADDFKAFTLDLPGAIKEPSLN